METKIIIAGSGGQGILFLGKALASAGMFEKKEVTWFPSYGAEMRGGTANCTVIVSDSMIGSPVVLTPDILIAMNRASLDKFQCRIKKGGTLLYDSSLIANPQLRDDIQSFGIPATKIASATGLTKSANMVMLGALISGTSLLKKSTVIGLFDNPPQLSGKNGAAANKKSILEGMHYIENQKS